MHTHTHTHTHAHTHTHTHKHTCIHTCTRHVPPLLRNPEVDTVSNIEDYSASHENGTTAISFRRPRISNDTINDRSLDTEFYILCAWSGAANTTTRNIYYHGLANRGSSSVQYMLPSADVCSQGILIHYTPKLYRQTFRKAYSSSTSTEWNAHNTYSMHYSLYVLQQVVQFLLFYPKIASETI